ncbi:SGNH/GDSL hydrolase family protein [Nocardia sp. NEAU-G5]|uniref:SGNH/GDSL hydrolase family protein n=1 Tax=Nocardia albiluteola TaxID=2842303 RepID=A0ABS6B7U6_9NOCA|nr:SGNH/GDSL hydrolase family protein [Nocardia albiluteola]MBU3066387.1 SGNH/GDSL hydrolase family protein [Nocardia albiluteola]
MSTVSAQAQPQHGDRYVALGSSYASGPGIAPQIDTKCARSGVDYPHLLAQRIGADLTDVTCSGAVTADILSRGQRIRSGGTVPPQIDAVTPDTKLVTVSIGGNDLNLIGGMIGRSCRSALTAAAPSVATVPAAAVRALRTCTSFASTAEPSAAEVATLGRDLTDVVRAVRAKAPHAKVLLVQYLPVLDAHATTCPGVVMSPADASATRRTYDELVTATRAAATASGATVVDMPDADSHTACSSTPWVNGFHNPLSGDSNSIGTSYHPNQAGMQAVADRLATFAPSNETLLPAIDSAPRILAPLVSHTG